MKKGVDDFPEMSTVGGAPFSWKGQAVRLSLVSGMRYNPRSKSLRLRYDKNANRISLSAGGKGNGRRKENVCRRKGNEGMQANGKGMRECMQRITKCKLSIDRLIDPRNLIGAPFEENKDAVVSDIRLPNSPIPSPLPPIPNSPISHPLPPLPPSHG